VTGQRRERMNERIGHGVGGHPSARSARIEYLDVLRVLSMLAVVLLHTMAGTLRANYGSSQWHFSNVLTALATASVPLFFMVSGALLLSSPRTASVGYSLKRRLPRVLVPFLVWSLIAVAYYLAVSWRFGGAADWTAAIEKLRHLPSSPTAIHLWFMYALIPLYILSPFIKKMVDALDRNLVIYLFAVWLFFSAVLPTVARFLPEPYSSLLLLDSRYDPSLMAGYAGYFVAGYYLARLDRSVSRAWLLLLVLVDLGLITLGTWWKTDRLGAYTEIFKTYSGLFVVVLSCALFLLGKEMLRTRRLGRSSARVVGFLAPLAFGVYLVHNLLVDLLSRLVPWWPASSVWMVVVSYLVVLAASIVLVFVLSIIKPLSYVLTGQTYGARKRRQSPTAPETTPTAPPELAQRAPSPLSQPVDPARVALAATRMPVHGEGQPPILGEQVGADLPKVWHRDQSPVKPPRPADDTAERQLDREWEI